MQKRVLIAAMWLSALVATVQAKEWKTIRIGLEAAYKPFTYKTPDGRLAGFDIDMANALCAQMKAKCTFVEQDWDGIIPALNAHKYDAIISSMSITEERKRVVAFSDKYYHTPSRLIAKLDKKLTGTPESMKGKRIGVLRGATQEQYAADLYGRAGAQVVPYGSQNEAFLDLSSGRLDATLVDSVVGKVDFLDTPAGRSYGFIGAVLDDPKYIGAGVAVAVRKSDTDLRDQFSAAIKAIRGNGVYKQVQTKYFDFDVYGN
ncbi:arginine/ornithine transport system substrate-binding protein [Chitinivorax tropicus]|uniref:Arginine/ornithine transport system substrate-binding protein n=1 Tax=Chitinivorax tropicus TaxID=714531 RepID=A0A840MP28_9PROT|nr:ABC transporter substrate-binding protein [Chitinivorax tropicus]MBB5017001.1 arginine/ornithine transport system substrate-binding protein [Chitinivorax tropicus]